MDAISFLLDLPIYLVFVFTPMFVVQADGKVGVKNDNSQYELDINGTIRSNILVTDGNMGIGTTNPQNKLDVNGTIRAKRSR